MQRPHSQFFSSLKQLEKRLKLDDNPTPTPTESSFSSPLYLYNDIANNIDSITSNNNNNSETPREFLSNSTNNTDPCQQEEEEEEGRVDDDNGVVDEIELLMQELSVTKRVEEVDLCDDGEFYGKIVGVKGPKCQKEVERLEGWVQHFHVNRLEPLRLAHLLLGKASLVHSNVEFPSTVDEFLHKDPPP